MTPPAGSAFHRHPRATLAAVWIVVLVVAVATAELLAGWRNTFGERAGEVRHVRLREHPPRVRFPVASTDAYQQATDGSFDQARHLLRTDANGFIEPSLVHEKADWTVVFLGGSTTECLLVEEQRRFPHLVGRLLELGRPGLKVNSVNAGVGGNDTLHSLTALAHKVAPLRPDAVVILHNINDLAVLVHEGSYWNAMPTRSPVVREDLGFAARTALREAKNRLVPNLWIGARNAGQRLARLLGREPDEFRGSRRPFEGDPEALAREFAANLRVLVGTCRARGITPVLMTMASRLAEHPDEEVRRGMGNLPGELLGDYAAMRGLFERFNETVRRVGAEEGVAVIDLARAIPQERRFVYDVVHLTDEGSERAAGLIADALVPLLPAGGGAGAAAGEGSR